MNEPQGLGWQSGGMPMAGVPPLLRIDWGCDLRAGSNLRPEFQLTCPGLRSLPQVTVHVDPRLDHEGWKDLPQLTQEGESFWVFDEPLRMTSGGQDCSPGMYSIELRAIFPEPGLPARCFRANVRIKVNDPNQQCGPTLEIDAGDASLVNLMGRDMAGFGKIVMKGSGQSVVNVQEALFPTGVPPGGETPARPAACVSEMLLKPDYELEQCMPRLAPRRSCALMDRAALVFPRGQRILLLAQPRAVLGRERVDKYGQRTSDIVLRLWPRETNAHQELSRLISRVHFRMSLRTDGLYVEDQSSCGTYLRGERIAQALLTHETALRPAVVTAAGVLGLEVTCHRDPTWKRWLEWIELIERQYQRVIDAASPLWADARAAGIDAVRLRRVRRLPVREFLGHLSQCLDPASYQTVHCAAHTIDLVDELADREQYVLVFRTATLGASPETDAICLPDSGLAAAHARIFHLGGYFWLEHLAEDQRICVDGQPLARHELVTLAPGMALSLGRTQVTFAEFNQPEL